MAGLSSPADAAPLDETELAAWRAFIETVTDLSTALESDLGAAGITLGDYQVLVFLTEAPDGALRMVDLANRLQLSPSGLTRRLDGLVHANHVQRKPSPEDRRVMLAVLTDAGRELLAAAYPVHLASVRTRIIERLSRTEVAAMERIFTKIRAGLAEQASSDS